MATLGNADDNLIIGGAGDDTVFANAGNDTVIGYNGNDVIGGGDGDDRLMGGGGDDRVSGGDGNDLVIGGEGDDTLSGGDGDDTITGGVGSDIVLGGEGRDTLRGGEDADLFLYHAATDSGLGVGVRDVILDFEVGVDKIGLSDFHLTAADIDLSTWFSGTSATNAYAQLLRIDTDHDGSFDMEIQLNATGGAVTLADLYL